MYRWKTSHCSTSTVFLVVFLAVASFISLLFPFGISWGAECVSVLSGAFVEGVGFYSGKILIGTSSHPVPVSVLTGSELNCDSGPGTGYAQEAAHTPEESPGCDSTTINPGIWVQWGTVFVWTQPNPSPGYGMRCGFSNYKWQIRYECASDPGAGYDYDCDGIPDNEDQDPATPDEDPEGNLGNPPGCDRMSR